MLKRTHNCGELNKNNLNNTVILNGWVNKVRFHGQVVFVDLRDRYGKTQLVFNSETFQKEFEKIKKLSMEDVLSVCGDVQERIANAINSNMKTGEIEVSVKEFQMLSESAPLPFIIADRNAARAAKDWGRADQVRDELTAMGIVLEDSAGKTSWRKI